MFLFSLLFACDSCKQYATYAIPALEESNPSWVDPVDCEESRIPTKSTAQKAYSETFNCDVDQKEPIIINGTTIGKEESLIGDQFYQNAACTPSKTHFYRRSPEAIYRLNLAPNTMAEIQLASNCADLDPFAYKWSRKSVPTEKHGRVSDTCELDTSAGDGRIVITTTKNEHQYLVGVDGKDGATGNFRLKIVCRSYR